MTPEQWQTLQDLFDEVTEKPLDQRPGVLSRLESQIQDSAVRLELRRLVEHAEVGAEFLRPVAGLGVYSDRPALQPGDVIADRFEILKSIGKGGMAEVFEAFDRKLGERVAIKIIAPEFTRDLSLLERFHQEVQIARRITHPNICRIHDLGEHQGLPYLSMELLEGETLSKRLERGPLPLEDWSDLAQQLLQGLRAAHAAGVVHRDLKPSNLMLTGSRLVILDFGLARPILTREDGGLTRTGTLVGTLDWMAPEQLLGEYNERSDLYSAALILLRALKQGSDTTGSGGLVGALRRATSDSEFRAQLPKNLPAPWRYALLFCLERDPKKRPRSVEDVQRLVQTQHVLPLRVRQFAGSNWKPLAIVLVVLALFGSSLRSLWYSRQVLQPLAVQPGAMIMVAFTDNATHEPQFDGITSVLRAEFGQSSHFNLWDERRSAEVLRGMRLDPQTKPNVQQWREMAFREHVPLLVFSTASKLGDGYRFSIKCEVIGTTPETPVDVREVTEAALGPIGLFEAIHNAVTSVRTAAGEGDTERATNDRLPQDITSSSWQALELYGDAQTLSDQQRSDDAVPLLRRAVQLDSNFAMASMRLGDILDTQQKVEEGLAYWRKAIELAATQHLSEHERLSIESRYALEIKDFRKAEPVLRDWMRKFPNDPLPSQLLAWSLIQMGNYEEGVRVGRDSQSRFAPTVFGTSVLIRGLAAKNELADIDKQIAILESLAGKPLATGFRGTIAAVRGNYPESERLFQDVMRSDDIREASRATGQLATLEADQGNLDKARQLLADGILKDRGTGQEGFASQKSVALAYLEGIAKHPERAVALAKDALSIRKSPLVIVQAVSLLARYGSPEDAARLMDTFPAGVGPRHEADLLRMKGEIFAARNNFKQALELLERAARTDQSQEPKEYLARALDLAGDHEGARLIYQRIIDTSFLTWIAEAEWPATRFMAVQYLKSSKGE
jgi:serine/threonine protein kinase/tetratricopeptide (TPR) repeat protein